VQDDGRSNREGPSGGCSVEKMDGCARIKKKSFCERKKKRNKIKTD
jgi:hypothetical protein